MLASPSKEAPSHVDAASAAVDIRSTSYTLVHLVAGETLKDVVIAQVITHMIEQTKAEGALRPARVLVVFLEPARVALRHSVRAWVREIRRTAPSLRVMLLPYVSRFSEPANATVLGRALRWEAGPGPVIFHCRGESAALWAMSMRAYFQRAGIVADIRGAWPEELLFAQGFDGPEQADELSYEHYQMSLSRLHSVLTNAGSVLSVSPALSEWLVAAGAAESKVGVVPCCISHLQFSAQDREDVRAELGVNGKLVFAYLGSMFKYQHLGDGLVPFFRALIRECDAAHLLCVTPDPESMRETLCHGGVSADRTTILRLSHDRVARYLCAADAGLLLRKRSRMNRFACPIKFAEYLASGVPVIVSQGIGETGSLVEASGAGLVVDVFCRNENVVLSEARRVLTTVSSRGEDLRNCALRLARERFLWTRYIDQVRGAYLRALGT